MENIAKKYADWCWGKTIPTEVGEIEKFFNRFLKEVGKKPIFVTEDGVPMFKGDTYYVPQRHGDWYKGVLDFTVDVIAPGKSKKLSTKEAAEKYIRDNRPQYSLKDVVEAVNNWAMVPVGENYVLNFFKKRGENEKE